MFSIREHKGGPITDWGAFFAAVLNGQLDLKAYCAVLKICFLSFCNWVFMKIIFQRVNVQIHVSHFTAQWAGNKSIRIKKWPALSPDLKPTENL